MSLPLALPLPPLSPLPLVAHSPPPPTRPIRTKHRADGLTRRSNLSLGVSPPPPTPPRLQIARADLAPRSRSLYPLRVLLPRFVTAASSRAPHRPSFCSLCHFAPPLVRACRSLPCRCPYLAPCAFLLSLACLPLSHVSFVLVSVAFPPSLSFPSLPHFRKSRQNSPRNDRLASQEGFWGKSEFSLDQREAEDAEMIKDA